jgi:hypothetical protein
MRVLLSFVMALTTASADVTLIRTPNGGIQPQAVADSGGRIHLVYFNGPARGGDLFYVHKGANGSAFSKPLRVNSRPDSAIAVGTIRGAQIALGKRGRLHVAWNSADGKEMLYTHLNDAGTRFEPERNLMTWTRGLDGGGSVAADDRGNVYVTWHGSAPDNKQGEAGRAVFVAHSRDEGKRFAREVRANPVETGACGCCGMKALVASNRLHILYRAATKMTGRDMILLAGNGSNFTQHVVSKWQLGSCPMSSAALLKGRQGVVAAWEMERQLGLLNNEKVVSPAGSGKRKHPSLAQNDLGLIVLAWAEDAGWEKGGTLAWAGFSDGKELGEIQRGEAIPVWSMPAAVAVGEQFYIIY